MPRGAYWVYGRIAGWRELTRRGDRDGVMYLLRRAPFRRAARVDQKKKKSATASLNMNYSTEDASERAFVFREVSVLDIAVSGSAVVVSCNADWYSTGSVTGCMSGAWKN